ncbi:hypothetical protein HPB47_025257 [Ixodes persulcatus]|uniref:Uncharacterized protein n=1 Tax=Ixodes persulcatus TaxID=34615 RepID=A0AC60Q2P7_IXOPE|nr:hypothetical protein HPB47_025257 [Ixodes persulcatus]
MPEICRRRIISGASLVRVLRHVGGWCLLRADPSGGSCALAVEQADPMCGPVQFRHPVYLAEKCHFFRIAVCPYLREAPIGHCHASKESGDLTGQRSHRDLGQVIPCETRPPADGGPVRAEAVPVAMCSFGHVRAGWNQ